MKSKKPLQIWSEIKVTRIFSFLLTVLVLSMLLNAAQPGLSKTVHAIQTDRFAPWASLVAVDQAAAGGGHYFPGLNITWLDFGPDIRGIRGLSGGGIRIWTFSGKTKHGPLE